jgi:hypothetical protein
MLWWAKDAMLNFPNPNLKVEINGKEIQLRDDEKNVPRFHPPKCHTFRVSVTNVDFAYDNVKERNQKANLSQSPKKKQKMLFLRTVPSHPFLCQTR